MSAVQAQPDDSQLHWEAFGRTRFESAADALYGTGSVGESAVYQRLHIGAGWHNAVVEAKLSVGLHAQTGLDSPGPKDRGPADLQEAYIGFHLADGLVNAKLGRQSILFGKKRFIDTSNSSNVRAAYDGIDVSLDRDNRQLRAFVVQPLRNRSEDSFDDRADDRLRLAVLQGSIDNRANDGSLWELYGLRFRSDSGTEREVRRAVGLRQVGSVLGWDTDIELQLQRGDVGLESVRAYALGAYASQSVDWSGTDSKLYMQLDIASGDDPGSRTVERFNPMLPSRSTFSQAGYTGYANLRHLKLGAELSQGPWKASAAVGLMQRMRTDDDVYAHSSKPLIGSDSASSARNSGTYLQLKAERSLWKNAKAYTEWVYLDAQKAITAAGGSDQHYFALSLEWSFED